MSHVAIYALFDSDIKVRYVGMTRNIDERMNTHRKRKLWIYGYEILEWATEDDWKEREIYWIAFYRNKYTLENIAKGGVGHPHTEQSRAKLSMAHKGKKRSTDWIRNYISSRSRGKGWVASPEARAKMSAARKGKPLSLNTRKAIKIAHSRPETIKKNRDAHLGKIASEQTRRKLSIAALRRHERGYYHSEVAISKMRKARIENPISVWKGKKLPESIRENMRKAWVIRKLKMMEASNVAHS